MINRPDPDILVQAETVYKGTIADPGAFGVAAARLVVEARGSRNFEALVVALHALARYHYARLEHAPAKALLDEAALLARRHALTVRLGNVLMSRAAVNIELGLFGPAQRDLDLAATAVSPHARASLALQQAALHHNVGRYAEAAAQYRGLLAMTDVPTDLEAKAANNLALIESDRGRPDLALDLLDRAGVAAHDAGAALVAGVTQSRGRVLMQAGRLVESLREFDEAGRVYASAGWALGEHYLEYADLLVELRLLPEAVRNAQRAFEQFDQHGVLLMAAEAQLLVAQLALLVGEPARAIEAAESVRRSMRRQRRTLLTAKAAATAAEGHSRSGELSRRFLTDARGAAETLERLGIVSSAVDAHLTAGRLALALGRRDDAAQSLRRSATLARKAPVLTRLKGRVAAALSAQVDGHPRAALQHCRAGLNDLAAHRSALASMELRALASGHGAELGALGLATLLPTGSAARVLEWLEKTRAAALVSVETPVVAGVEDELIALRAVQAEITMERRETGEESAELLRRQAALEGRIRRASWAEEGSPTAADPMIAPGELRRLLDGRTLVEYGVLDDELIAAVLDSRRTRLVCLGSYDGVSAEGEALRFALRRLSRGSAARPSRAARTAATAGVSRLRELLIAPLRLDAETPLVVVPVGELQRIPWSPLHSAPVSVAPSASFWARTRQRRQQSDRVVLVAGPGLAGATEEVQQLSKLHHDPLVLVPPDSSVETVAAGLQAAAFAHLACHGAQRSDNPTFSSLLLSDGPLTVHELTLRGIAPHRIVLASCDSGADVVYEGNEMLGFVSGLMARGTAGMVGTMVVIPDLDSIPLMRALHEHVLAGAALPEALHQARAGIDTESDPGFLTWCAFTAFGAA
ncbi:MAG: CHAT domain-containing protein [Actinomycetota bacterium]